MHKDASLYPAGSYSLVLMRAGKQVAGIYPEHKITPLDTGVCFTVFVSSSKNYQKKFHYV